METNESIIELFHLGDAKPDQPPRFAKVTAISGDTVTVTLGASNVDAVRCCDCVADDVVLLETLPSGQLAAVGVKGYNGGGGGGSYSAGTGLTLNGSTFDHSNAVTAGTIGTSSATSGSTLAVPYATYDAQGHITAQGTHTHTVTGFKKDVVHYMGAVQSGTGYLRLCTIDTGSATNHGDAPIRIVYAHRNSGDAYVPDYCTMVINYSSAADPSVIVFNAYGLKDQDAKLVKDAEYTWSLWIRKWANWDTLTVYECVVPNPPITTVSISWSAAVAANYSGTTPTGLIVETVRNCSGRTWYGTCSTAAGTAAKVVTCSEFVLAKGATITVRFTYGSSVSGAITLNVNGTGAVAVYKHEQATGAGNVVYIGYFSLAQFVYDGTRWEVAWVQGALDTIAWDQPASANLNLARIGVRHIPATNTMTTGKPSGNGNILHFSWPWSSAYAGQLFIPGGGVQGLYPQWRESYNSTWSAWHTFYTDANPPALTACTGTLGTSQLPIATTSALGGVKPDGVTITADADGVITSYGGGIGCTESSGGSYTWAYYITTAASSWPASDAYGWREEKWSDGRLTVWVWAWHNMEADTARDLTYTFPAGPTAFTDTPNYSVVPFASAAAQVVYTVTSFTPNTSMGFRLTRSGAACRVAFQIRMDGHWN